MLYILNRRSGWKGGRARSLGGGGNRPVDALVGGAGIAQACASVQANGVVVRGSHHLEIEALLCFGASA